MSMFEPWIRNSFEVQAVRITEMNLFAVSVWCDGTIGQSTGEHPKKYVLLNTQQYNKLMQTKAYVGDWVIVFPDGHFKHYRDESFRAAYKPKLSKYEDILVLVEMAMRGSTWTTDAFGKIVTSAEIAAEITKLFEGE